MSSIISSDNYIKIDKNEFQKMIFINNVINDGWTVKKSETSYIFTKKHENRREIFQENYLESFIHENCTMK
jgi:hypothetical protein